MDSPGPAFPHIPLHAKFGRQAAQHAPLYQCPNVPPVLSVRQFDPGAQSVRSVRKRQTAGHSGTGKGFRSIVLPIGYHIRKLDASGQKLFGKIANSRGLIVGNDNSLQYAIIGRPKLERPAL